MDRTLTKTGRNRLHMEIYWQERFSKKQKQKIREYDKKKRAAETRLEKKMEQESIREKSWKSSKKYTEIQKKFQLPLRNFKNLSPRCVTLQKIIPEKLRLLQTQWLHITLV